MKFDIRLAAIDLDETLLDSNHLISPRNASAVRKLIEHNVTCVLASGRMHESILRYARQLGLNAPIISYNGSMIKLSGSNEAIYHKRLPVDLAREIVSYCQKNGHHLNYYCDDRLYVDKLNEWTAIYHSQTGSDIHPVGDLKTLTCLEPTKLILIDNPATISKLLIEMKERFSDSLYITTTNPEYLEFMNPEANKGSALKWLSQRLGIPQAQTMAFGDNLNDIAMLQWAGTSIAMGNAKPEVKAVAHHVTGTNNDDGFAGFVEDMMS